MSNPMLDPARWAGFTAPPQPAHHCRPGFVSRCEFNGQYAIRHHHPEALTLLSALLADELKCTRTVAADPAIRADDTWRRNTNAGLELRARELDRLAAAIRGLKFSVNPDSNPTLLESLLTEGDVTRG